ncbi:hypothetical protein TPHA_0D00880 [Tetrapisispora phaffii CBS 4417]|uniref:Uncharacterized protein n=1 Tax=Tetrapisispora phaffii (strain ATCC 24235 / CBS 4417 / NBRC 1672 / NRRL Y-8282 / UCD 70-5) TaxID=1071381 RepID=G8BSB0_TETPH|nr:hypothetical protein TPHA_0D00880 [Tetrapisispora phaffii CBS 4417]CCE62731.1 hypothetical protein TPHA_0D00880 [Tetrapisispora phaffii CBS 4417]
MPKSNVSDIVNSLKVLKLNDENVESSKSNYSDNFKSLINENYYLQMQLKEKDSELMKLRKHGQVEQQRHNVYDYKLGTTDEDKFSNFGSDLISHFSESPMKCKRGTSVKTETSLATTNITEINKDHLLFKNNVIPFIENLILILNTNFIFEKECNDLNNLYKQFLENTAEQDSQLLNNILTKIIFLTRQLVAILNKELKFSKRNKNIESKDTHRDRSKHHYNQIDMKYLQEQILYKLDELANKKQKYRKPQYSKESEKGLEIIPIGYREQKNELKQQKRDPTQSSSSREKCSRSKRKDSLQNFLLEVQNEYTSKSFHS